jgi:hypothetical protein
MWTIETGPQTPEQDQYAARLFARLDEAIMLKRFEVNIGDWQPTAHDCHANATQIHLHSASYLPVRGWLYFDFGGHLDRVQFLAHSAIRAPDGELWDVTPSHASQEYPFIPAEDSEDEYAARVESGVTRIWHIK